MKKIQKLRKLIPELFLSLFLIQRTGFYHVTDSKIVHKLYKLFLDGKKKYTNLMYVFRVMFLKVTISKF